MRTLEITSYVGCPNMCDYCPQPLLKRKYKGKRSMSLVDFTQLLANVPKDVRIDFSGFSEIFFNKEGSEMIRWAYRSGYQVVLYTTLEGFTVGDIHYLEDVKFADLCFHKWPGVDEVGFIAKVELFERQISKGRIAEITSEWKWSRAGTVWDRAEKKGVFTCLFAGKNFDHNVVLPNGNVYLCCQDYGLRHCLGNLYETPFDDLNRQQFTDMSNETDSDIICRKCEIAQFT